MGYWRAYPRARVVRPRGSWVGITGDVTERDDLAMRAVVTSYTLPTERTTHAASEHLLVVGLIRVYGKVGC
jgi:hypothetical protein